MISATTCLAQEDSEKGVSIGEWEFSLPLNYKTITDDTERKNDTIVKYENEKSYFYIYKRHRQYITPDGGFYVGFCDAVGGPSDMNVKLGSSVEIGIQNLLSAKFRPWKSNKRHSFSIGAG